MRRHVDLNQATKGPAHGLSREGRSYGLTKQLQNPKFARNKRPRAAGVKALLCWSSRDDERFSPRGKDPTRLSARFAASIGPTSEPHSFLTYPGERGKRTGPPRSVNETLTKQFPNATKPFWRFRANVLKRFTCTRFPDDAPRTARLGVETGDDQCFIHLS
jgi:hypothetical protein